MQELGSSEFEEVIKSKEKPVVIMVKTTHCPSCKALAPVFEKTGGELKDKADFNYLGLSSNNDSKLLYI